MRVTVVVLTVLLTACSSEVLRCERHLTPINPPRKLLGDAAAGPESGSVPVLAPSPGRAAPQGRTKKIEVHNSSAKSQVTLPAKGGRP